MPGVLAAASWRPLLPLLLSLALSGCGCVISTAKDGATVRHVFGYATITTYPSSPEEGGASAARLRLAGISLDRGLHIGVIDQYEEIIPPDCRLVVKVPDKARLEETLRQLEPIVKDGLCVTVDPSLAR